MRIVACHVDVQFYPKKKKKGSIVKALFRDRSRQACGPTDQQAQYSEKLPSNRYNYLQSTVRRQLAEKSTQAQEGCFWVGGWLVGWLVVVGEKRQVMWGKKGQKKKRKQSKEKWERETKWPRGELKRQEDKTGGTEMHRRTERVRVADIVIS